MAGGTELTTYLNLIRQEKTNKIIPTNIKSGIEVLGVTGEYTGIKTYSSVSAMNNDLANIQENEIAKVVVDNATTYYIKNTTMKELYKEGTTLSPTDYEQAQVQIANLLDEDVLQYTELEYIQSSGTQYIDTDINENNCYSLRFEFTPVSIQSSWQSYLAGTEDDFTIGAKNNALQACYLRWRTNEIAQTDNILYTDSKNTLTIGNNTFTVNGTSFSGIISSSAIGTGGSNIIICDNASFNRRSPIRIYSLVLYNRNGKKLRDFIPVKRISDDETCLYDKVEGEFYTNDGTGDFIAGPEID